MAKYNGLIIPRSYNDYYSRSDPTSIKQMIDQITDAELNALSDNPLQNQAIAKLVPAAASEDNQLADKAFVNSSVGTNTANYIYKTTETGENVPFESIEELEAYTGTVTQNDYAFVTGTDDSGNVYFDRYKADVDGATVTWGKEYRLNNSSFTAEQWAAIQSGITAELVAKIGDAGIVPLTTAAYNNLPDSEKDGEKLHLITDAQNGFIAITDEVQAGSQAAVTSNAVNNALTEYSKNIYNFDEEVIIGYVIQNGVKKPIYRKAGFAERINSNSEPILDSTLTTSYVKNIINTGGCVNQGGNILSIGGYAFSEYRTNISVRNDGLHFLTSHDAYTNVNWWIEYTKTTD